MAKTVWLAALPLGVALAGSSYSGLLAERVAPALQGGRAVRQTQAPGAAVQSMPQGDRALLDRYCVTCHNDQRKTAGLSLTAFDPNEVEAAPEVWEKVVRKLRTASMPPPKLPRPDAAATDAFVARLETALDRWGEISPNPGRPAIHRLNRSQYVNAIRDLLGIELDGPSILPADNVVEGFDNIAGGLTVSPLLMERYLAVAKRVSRLAIEDPTIGPGFEAKTYATSPTQFQDYRMSEDLPFGSRGGLAVRHRFPLDGEYRVKVLLRRQLYHFIRGLGEEHQLEIRIDGKRVRTFTVGGQDHGTPAPISYGGDYGITKGTSAEWEKYWQSADLDLEVRIPVSAGTHLVGVSFIARDYEAEGILQQGPVGFTFSVDESLTSSISGRLEPAVYTVEIVGPYPRSSPDDTARRPRLFTCQPKVPSDERPCASRIFAALARRAFRRPVTDADIEPVMRSYEGGRRDGGFDRGIQEGLVRILVDPEFLFRIERQPLATPQASVYQLTDVQLASRLSFFLWNSLPDDELLDLASRGQLAAAPVLDRQVRRMLADQRSSTLVVDFASQWLGLRALDGIAPNPELFPETVYDESLRDSFRRETELFIENQLREDHSVTDMLTADYTFVDERLARHYDIPNVYGGRFRRVRPLNGQRGGLLGQGSVLMLTSYPDRTSPVLRGKWLLENVFGTAPPDPPANVPALELKSVDGAPLSAKAQMVQHRRDPVCSTCHARMDPLGLALENFDAIGKWRKVGEDGRPIDATGSLPDGTTLAGIDDLRKLAVSHSHDFVTTLTEKMLMYALGRGIDYYDMPAVRRVVREAAPDGFRWSSIILGIVKSKPFQMRRSEP
jgi:mono/diheme cytochrome c family protein